MPLLWPVLMSAAGALGYKLLTSTADDAPLRGRLTAKLKRMRTVQLPLDEVLRGVVAEEVGRDQVLRFVRDDVTLVFKRNARGKFFIEVMASDSHTPRELRALGEEFAKEIIQQFAYNRLLAELERRGAHVVEERVEQDGSIVLELRQWK